MLHHKMRKHCPVFTIEAEVEKKKTANVAATKPK